MSSDGDHALSNADDAPGCCRGWPGVAGCGRVCFALAAHRMALVETDTSVRECCGVPWMDQHEPPTLPP